MDIPEKKTYGYQERDEEKRQEFKLKISQTKPENRVYIDESGMDNREDYGAASEGSKSRLATLWRIRACDGTREEKDSMT